MSPSVEADKEFRFSGVNVAYASQAHMHLRLQSLGRVQCSATPGNVARPAPPFVRLPGKKTGVGCHFLHQGIFLTQGLNLRLLLLCPALAGRLFTAEPPGKPS